MAVSPEFGMSTVSNQPAGGGTMTTANWWEMPNLTPGTIAAQPNWVTPGLRHEGGGRKRFSSPESFYSFWEQLDPAGQEEYTVLTAPMGEDPFSLETPFEFPEPEDIEDWIPQATDQILDFLETRMSDDYTSFTPAMRGQIATMIGRELQLANRQAVESAARAGVYSGGIESQLRSEAALGAAGAMGQAQAQMESQDERTQQWAAEELRRMQSGEQDRYENYMRSFGAGGLGYAEAVGPTMLAGADIQYEDVISWFQANEEMQHYLEEMKRAEEAGKIQPVDWLQVGIALLQLA